MHPETLDIREFKPQLDLYKRGYFVFSTAEQLYAKADGETIDRILQEFYPNKKRGRQSKADIITKLWPEIVLRGINNLAPVPLLKRETEEEALAKQFNRPTGAPPTELVGFPTQGRRIGITDDREDLLRKHANINQKVDSTVHKLGRGNHNPRLPNFELTGADHEGRLPPQAQLLSVGFKTLFNAKVTTVTQAEVPEYLREMRLATTQDPMRIFRYYFWALVQAGVIKVENTIRVDSVVKRLNTRVGG
jgi:hypothetical protein